MFTVLNNKNGFIMAGIILGLAVLLIGVIWFSQPFNLNINFIKSGLFNKYEIDESETMPLNMLENVKSIKAEAVSSDIAVKLIEGNSINAHFYGSFSSLNENNKPELVIETSTEGIHIRVKYPGSNINIIASDTKLDIEIPEAYANEFIFTNISGNITADKINCSNIKISTTSGDIKAGIITASGNINCSSISGSISGEKFSCDNIVAKTTSGNINVSLNSMGNSAYMKSISGNIKLYMPDSSMFMLSASSISGNIDCKFTMENYVSKRGSIQGRTGITDNKVEIETTSGSIGIFKKSY